MAREVERMDMSSSVGGLSKPPEAVGRARVMSERDVWRCRRMSAATVTQSDSESRGGPSPRAEGRASVESPLLLSSLLESVLEWEWVVGKGLAPPNAGRKLDSAASSDAVESAGTLLSPAAVVGGDAAFGDFPATARLSDKDGVWRRRRLRARRAGL